MDIKIAVAAHKPYWRPADDMYFPIQAGAEGKTPIAGFTPDNTGENISAKNPNYCELTALYWLWKNFDADAVGLVHYRRYFERKHFAPAREKTEWLLRRKDVENLLARYDIILPVKNCFGRKNMRTHYAECHHVKDFDLAGEILAEKYPEYVADFKRVSLRHRAYCCNMFVMKKAEADRYCAWLFDVLGEVEARVDLHEYDDYQKRIYGFLGERLFNVWIEHQKLKIKELPVASLEEDDDALPLKKRTREQIKRIVCTVWDWFI